MNDIAQDTFAMAIEFAIDNTMKQYKNSEDKNDKIVYRMLQASKPVWKNLYIHGLKMWGMTHERLLEQLKEKNNVVFLSDKEIADYNKAMKIIDVMNGVEDDEK